MMPSLSESRSVAKKRISSIAKSLPEPLLFRFRKERSAVVALPEF